jgi:ketosteroid isomerase-like protein
VASANLDLVRSICAAWERGDFSRAAEWTHPEIEYVDGDRELDGERVLVLTRWRGPGKTSGLDVGQMSANGAVLFHGRDGKVTRLVTFFDRRRGLAVLGLASEAGSL